MSDAVTHPIALYLPTTPAETAMVHEGHPRPLARAAALVGWYRHCAQQLAREAVRFL
jgi:hypothetical protein